MIENFAALYCKHACRVIRERIPELELARQKYSVLQRDPAGYDRLSALFGTNPSTFFQRIISRCSMWSTGPSSACFMLNMPGQPRAVGLGSKPTDGRALFVYVSGFAMQCTGRLGDAQFYTQPVVFPVVGRALATKAQVIHAAHVDAQFTSKTARDILDGKIGLLRSFELMTNRDSEFVGTCERLALTEYPFTPVGGHMSRVYEAVFLTWDGKDDQRLVGHENEFREPRFDYPDT